MPEELEIQPLVVKRLANLLNLGQHFLGHYRDIVNFATAGVQLCIRRYTAVLGPRSAPAPIWAMEELKEQRGQEDAAREKKVRLRMVLWAVSETLRGPEPLRGPEADSAKKGEAELGQVEYRICHPVVRSLKPPQHRVNQ